MRKMNWMGWALGAVVTSALLGGCQSGGNGSVESQKEGATNTEVAAGTPTAAPAEGAAAAGSAGTPATTPEKSTDSGTPKSESTQKTEGASLADQATTRRDTSQQDPKEVQLTEEELKNAGKEIPDPRPAVPQEPSRPTKPATPAQASGPKLPEGSNARAVANNFVGRWKWYVSPEAMRGFNRLREQRQKQGAKVLPLDSVMEIRADGTFFWRDSLMVISRTLEGRWTVKNGVAEFTVTKYDGSAPKKNQEAKFTAAVSQDGRRLFRNLNGQARFDKL